MSNASPEMSSHTAYTSNPARHLPFQDLVFLSESEKLQEYQCNFIVSCFIEFSVDMLETTKLHYYIF